MTFDATNRKDIRNAEKRAKITDANRVNFIRTIMGTIGGREWMHGLLRNCHVFSTPYVAGDPHATAFNCGQQNIGLQTFADVVSQTPQQYALMMQEAQTKDEADGRRNSTNESTNHTSDPGADIDSNGFVTYASRVTHDDSAGDDTIN